MAITARKDFFVFWEKMGNLFVDSLNLFYILLMKCIKANIVSIYYGLAKLYIFIFLYIFLLNPLILLYYHFLKSLREL